MATIVTPMNCESSSQSTMLFQGKNFLVHRRIPEYNEIVEMIKANGGILVKLDQNADIKISDHMRGCPEENSINWTFIRDSVLNGRLQNIDEYRAEPNANTLPNFEVKRPRKDIRVAFTSDDDRILSEWCTDKENLSKFSNCLSGNSIFQALEKIVR
ncbi:putative arid-like protein [Erysiphe neolycopersici]|uniref:DNA-binding protein RAP1 n=1 Tax=Erysiphe neolycopersici TaxID=212602 RepID=A0A420HLM3_9PEZI|nr:putative arid-like protein [Erysiphe neolycopersici]